MFVGMHHKPLIRQAKDLISLNTSALPSHLYDLLVRCQQIGASD